ncbi:MAG: hypothetical protein ABJD07_02005 [Gemmatimonadaceae bacterium]
MTHHSSRRRAVAAAVAMFAVSSFAPSPAYGQRAPLASDGKFGGSPNVHVLGHIEMGGFFRVGGMDMESEPSRPYMYATRILDEAGFSIVNIADPRKPKVIFDWRIPNVEQHSGVGGEAGKYFKLKGRYYYAKCLQFEANTPDYDLSMIVFDVTGLPDVSKVKEVARVHGGPTTHVFPYKHSDGRVILFSTPGPSQGVNIYDAEKLIAGDAKEGLIGHVGSASAQPTRAPDGTVRNPSFHDTYAAYDPAKQRDVLFGAGTGGFYVWDVSRPEEAKLLTSLTAGGGVIVGGHTIQASPDQRYAVTEVEKAYFPVMVFDLQPGLEQNVPLIGTPVGAWTADWRDLSHDSDLRWPYLFVAAYEDGFQVVSLADPKDPRTVGWYYTCECAHNTGYGGIRNVRGTSAMNGAGDVHVRNYDGLIAVSDYTSGLWLFKVDGFDGWNGAKYRLPNISSEQDWDGGPARGTATKPRSTP